MKNIKIWILAYISFRFFLAGVEEFIILPTVWTYIDSLGGSVGFLGIVAAAYAISVGLFALLFKILTRKCRHVYIITVVSSFVKLGASVMYSMPISKLFPLFGRLISGLADSCDGVIYKEMSRYTEEVDHMQYGLVFDGVFTLGTAFGAVVCSSLTLHQHIFGWSKWSVDVGNSPGFILAVIWLIFFTLTLYLPCTFGVDVTMTKDDEKEGSGSEMEAINSDNAMESDSTQAAAVPEKAPPKCFDSRVACLLYLAFTTMFFASCASFFPSLLAIKLFHLKVLHVKLLFVNGTLTLVLLFLVLYMSARYFEERTLLVFILSIQLPSLIVLVYIATLWTDVSPNNCYVLIVYICLGLPYFGFSICGSLLQKFTNVAHFSSFYQPLFIGLIQLAIISSRVIGGFVFSKPAFFVFSVCLVFMWLVGIVWFGFVFGKLATSKNRYSR